MAITDEENPGLPLFWVGPPQVMNGKENPKNYPYWEELIQRIPKNIHIVQVGIEGEKQLVDDFRKNLPISELKKLIKQISMG